MSLFTDIKYLRMIGSRLPQFTPKAEGPTNYLWNCRCVLCGDSQKKKNKIRGYFYRSKNALAYKCHNCGASMYFGTFLKQFDATLYHEYSYENYLENKTPAFEDTVKFVPVRAFAEKVEGKFLTDVAIPLSDLCEENEAVQYCLSRQIPEQHFSKLFWIERAKDIAKIAPEKYASIQNDEPRLVIPFYDEHGQLTEVTMRGLRGESLRYINVKMIEDATAIFGLDTVDREETIMVTEGPLDSLFLENAIAVGGTGFIKLEPLPIFKEQFVLIFDNEPRNKDVCKVMEKFVNMGYRVVIWPCEVKEKDINEMVLVGRDPERIIEANVYQGLMAQAKFSFWKTC